MTVKELIEALGRYDENAVVYKCPDVYYDELDFIYENDSGEVVL